MGLVHFSLLQHSTKNDVHFYINLIKKNTIHRTVNKIGVEKTVLRKLTHIEIEKENLVYITYYHII